MVLKTIRDELEAVVKKQELTTTKFHQLIDKLNDEIQQAISDLQFQPTGEEEEEDMDHKSVIQRLKEKLDTYTPQQQINKLKKDLKVDLLINILGKFMETDISKAHRNVEFDSQIVKQTILNLLHHEGLFHITDIFLNESQGPDIILVRLKFQHMHEILKALNAKELDPAVNWMCVNRERLQQNKSTLEFDLRRLQFLDLLPKVHQSDALRFAETHLSQFASTRSTEVFGLMGCIYSPEKLQTLLSPEKWAEVSREFVVQFCGSMGMAVVVAAGGEALPKFLDFVNETAVNREVWEAKREREECPVSLNLGDEFQFHAIFVCPVTTEQSDRNNSAMLLVPCGHMFSWKTVWKVSKGYRQMFKCPGCNRPVLPGQCRQLCF